MCGARPVIVPVGFSGGRTKNEHGYYEQIRFPWSHWQKMTMVPRDPPLHPRSPCLSKICECSDSGRTNRQHSFRRNQVLRRTSVQRLRYALEVRGTMTYVTKRETSAPLASNVTKVILGAANSHNNDQRHPTIACGCPAFFTGYNRSNTVVQAMK